MTMSKLLLAALAVAAPLQAQQVAGPCAPAAKPVTAPGEVARGAPVNGVLVLEAFSFEPARGRRN